MGWEWRYFVPSMMPATADALRGCREDVYYAATAGAGLKLRDGAGELEVKRRTKTALIAGRGEAEKWKKRIHRGCITAAGDLDVAACVAQTGRSATELFGQGGAPLAARVLCRKDREHTSHGERTDCLLLGFVGRGAAEPVLVERWTSVSVEIGDPEALARAVQVRAAQSDACAAGWAGLVRSGLPSTDATAARRRRSSRTGRSSAATRGTWWRSRGAPSPQRPWQSHHRRARRSLHWRARRRRRAREIMPPWSSHVGMSHISRRRRRRKGCSSWRRRPHSRPPLAQSHTANCGKARAPR